MHTRCKCVLYYFAVGRYGDNVNNGMCSESVFNCISLDEHNA